MSMIDAIPLLAGAGAGADGGYQISRSVRLRSSASAYFNRTPASTGNRKTWTWSGWVKLGSLSTTLNLMYAYSADSDSGLCQLSFQSNQLRIQGFSASFLMVSTPIYRDPSAWYHIVYKVDTTQATVADRVRVYVNGVQITAWATNTPPPQNTDTAVNNNVAHNIGRNTRNSNDYLDGYLTEINFIDGQALTPSSFGETNSVTGVWQPKAYAGTYGTNGFYLNFSDNSGVTATTIGKDYSGNGNNWTPNNISITAGTTYDSMIDVPTLYADGGNGRGNYCTLNPLENPAGFTLSGGNLDMSGANAWRGTRATIGVTSGKWYWEYIHTSATAGGGTGISTQAGYTWAQMATNDMGVYSGGWEYIYTGQKGNNNSFVSYGAAFTQNDVIGVAFDADTGTLTFYKNGVSQGTAYTGLTSGPYFPTDAGAFGGNNYNFGQRPFSYTPPSGFVALNTQNLPTPTISNGASYMDAKLWTGNGTSQTISGLGFEPDFAWIKSRSIGYQHSVYDAVRTTSAGRLATDQTLGEASNGANNPSFTSDGITVRSVLNDNGSGQTFVGWMWDAGTSTVTNTSGSISAQVRANPTAGFSVVTWTGTGAVGTIGHGLGVAPSFVIVKYRTGTAPNIAGWGCYHRSLTSAAYRIDLNSTSAQISDTNAWNSTAPTSSVVTIGTNLSVASTTMVAYCFAEVAGYSAFGKYTGNGSTDGPFVFTNFRPRWVMIKRTDTAGENWEMWDSSRGAYNIDTPLLYANLSNAETAGSAARFDALSNGFKIRSTNAGVNASGGTYVYAAFCENPFKLSLAR